MTRPPWALAQTPALSAPCGIVGNIRLTDVSPGRPGLDALSWDDWMARGLSIWMLDTAAGMREIYVCTAGAPPPAGAIPHPRPTAPIAPLAPPEGRCEDLGMLSNLSYEHIQDWRSKGFVNFYTNGGPGNLRVYVCNSGIVRPPAGSDRVGSFCQTISPLSKPDYVKIKSFQGAPGVFWVVPASSMGSSEPYIVWCNLFATQSQGSVRWDPTTPLPARPPVLHRPVFRPWGVIFIPVPAQAPARAPGTPQPTALLTPDETLRLLGLAESSRGAVDEALARAAIAGASDSDKAAGQAAKACLDDLIKAAGPFQAVLAELNNAVKVGRGAKVTAAQAAAIQTFADCAQAAEGARATAPTGGLLKALVGVGLPAVATALVAL